MARKKATGNDIPNWVVLVLLVVVVVVSTVSIIMFMDAAKNAQPVILDKEVGVATLTISEPEAPAAEDFETVEGTGNAAIEITE